MARGSRGRLWVSFVGVIGLHIGASPDAVGLIGQAVAQTSEQAEDEPTEVERIGDWILRLFQSSEDDTDEPPATRRNGNRNEGNGGGSASGGSGGSGGGSGGGGSGGDDNGGGDDGGDDGGGDDGGGDDGGGDDGGEGGDDD